jgi:hypothetical protein
MAAYNFSLDTSSPRYDITLERVGAQGPAGTAGASGSAGWLTYATAFSSTPTLTAALVGGDVYTYLYNNDVLTLYRYITGTSDSFFTDFDGTTLTGLVSTKQTTISIP